MSKPLLFTNKDDINNSDTATEDEQVNIWPETQRHEKYSFFTLIKRLCIYWNRVLLEKTRLIFSLAYMSMLNMSARITCFLRHRKPSPPPSTFTAPMLPSSSFRTLEEDFHDSSQSLLPVDHTPEETIDLPSLSNSQMANILVQQQRTHRSPSISIHPSSSKQKDSKLPMAHSVDDRLFLHGSTELFNFLTRFSSEPHMSKYHTPATNSHGQFSKSSEVFALSTPVSNGFAQVTEPKNEEIHFEDIFYLNCDQIQPVSASSFEDFDSDKIDSMSTTTPSPSSEQETSIDAVKLQDLDEDKLLEISPAVNNHDQPCERHFRRRKRRSSLTRNSLTLDDTQSPADLVAKLDIHQQQSPEVQENFSAEANDQAEDTPVIEAKPSKNEESNQTTVNEEEPSSVSRYRGRRQRHRLYRQTTSTASSSEVASNNSPQFDLLGEALNVELPRMPTPSPSPSPSSPDALSPLPSSLSPMLTITSNSTKPNPISGAVKRANPPGVTKKNVRFADSVGRELAQVQYIRSSSSDEAKEFSFLLGSSLLSSSPPAFSKNNLYLSNTSLFEHKPWSFDVAPTMNTHVKESPTFRRFFCLFRQPNSEHPDVYLHEVWKSQIKLEHAEIPLRSSSTDEQQLIGTLWVTNAGYSKYVSIKYTFNRWLNTYEHEAQHRCHSNDFRNLDQFHFTINLPADVDRVDFVLRYCVNGQEHYDNNEGKNYTLQMESAYLPSTTISLPHDCDFNEMRFY